jgi:hypothetical protein
VLIVSPQVLSSVGALVDIYAVLENVSLAVIVHQIPDFTPASYTQGDVATGGRASAHRSAKSTDSIRVRTPLKSYAMHQERAEDASNSVCIYPGVASGRESSGG